ncbi:hypothetical protein LCY76_02320 [Fictibacillus sp. KIGAM418]|uniref:Uncharacterized protein n=1 Tax=Fictibacillus marinisediminis TaxID=2878389 RepID=A0A9X2BC79_9BACL|nr:hypothetical protein [Fictibacillus marinisediminis]MCK6255460.1 hypothetical protein [Fictibacillus marinisediminis]
MSFQPSINIMYDIGKVQLFENYVPNIKQLDIMDQMIKDLVETEQHAHLLVGPYGAGKSLVGAMITSLLTQNKINKAIKQFFQDVNTVSPELEMDLRETLIKNKIKWLPILITGKTGDFESILLESIQRKCEENGIGLTLKNDIVYILELIDIWEQDFNDIYVSLENHLQKSQYTIEQFKEELNNNSESAVHLFKEIYPTIAFGTVYYNPHKIAFTEQLQYIFEQLAKKKAGLLIVFDEFGRFLQTVSNAQIHLTMQHIQDLAELVNRQQNAFLLMITHTGLQQYVNANTNLTQDELERVEKRFLEHRLESDSSIFYRSAHKLLNKPKDYKPDMFLASDYEQFQYLIMKYNLFPNMTTEEIGGTIIEGCQPIHPVTIQLLPGISNLLGQNDRTLYMFLNEFKIENMQGNWYYADQLFEYFYPDESMILTLDTMKFYRLAISYKVSKPSLRVVKLATLLKILNNRFTITTDFLQFALGIDQATAQKSIEELVQVRLLRLNPFTKAYELFEGSLIALEDIYKEVEKSSVLDDELRIKAIENLFGQKYYIPLGYNNAKAITRYFEIRFIFGEQPFEIDPYEDGMLLYVITRSQNEREQVEERIKNYINKDILFGVTNIDFVKLSEHINQYLVLNNMLQKPDILQRDANLEKEITLQIESITFVIQQMFKPLKKFNKDDVCYYLGRQEVSFNNMHQFESFLDKWMFDRFPYTPEIRNESFNKRTIMAIQRKSAISILEQILQQTFDGTFELSGNGPDYLIYATTFKNLNFNFVDLDKQPVRELAELRKRLLGHLESSKRNSIYSLFSIALLEPFGIRAPLVPLLIVALLKDKWHQMAFYSNDFSLSEMNAQILYEILEQSAEFYEYEIYSLNEEIIETLQNLSKIYLDYENTLPPNTLFKELNQWLLKLPRFTQITNKQSAEVLKFKQIIRSSEMDPLLASKEFTNLALSKEQYYGIKEYLEGFVEEFKKKLFKKTFAVFNVKKVEQIRVKHVDTIKRSPQLLDLVQILEQEQNFDSFIVNVVGVRLEDWSDVTYDSYFATLMQLLTTADSETIKIIEGDQVISTVKEIDLSVKGNTIYNQLLRIVTAGGRTMNLEEVKYILYRILKEMK